MTSRSREKSTTIRQCVCKYIYPGQHEPDWVYGYTASFTELMDDQTGIPKYTRGNLTWKPCCHVVTARPAEAHVVTYQNGKTFYDIVLRAPVYNPVVPNAPSSLYEEAYSSMLEEIDLNCHDRVMMYSYIADLMPFLGVFTRASSVLNKIGRWVSRTQRSLRHRPFTEVMKLVISGDLINRFVVQTTVKDTVDILNVYDRCLRAFQMANLRNQAPTVLTSSASSKTEGSTSSYTLGRGYDAYGGIIAPNAHVRSISAMRRLTTSFSLQLKARMMVKYDTATADPFRWVVHALGIDTPLESVWDKIPFSFVVDYFFRVGELIETLGERSNQYGLQGRICSIDGVWEMLSTQVGYHYSDLSVDAESPWVTGWDGDFTNTLSGHKVFTRSPGSLPKAVGFWDKGGLWKPHLSSVRKRTLLELGFQVLNRGRS